MWLLPVFSQVSNAALRVFYRLSVDGERVPARGPALLVANHPNSLLDPAMVVAVAGRPVRFLAKAPLFTDRMVGWLIRGSGSLPVYRKQDDPSAMGQNEDTFRAVHEALASGSAVGLFPEGTSHSEPSLVPLKTGAARIALGAADVVGGPFPLVPVGLVFRRKERFRSQAHAVIGAPVPWDDLAGRGEDDAAAVRELTRRIDDALHEVTVNVERWDDAPLVATAEAVIAAELPSLPGDAARVSRTRDVAERFAALRASGDPQLAQLARDVATHARLLRVVGLTPEELHGRASASTAAGWTARQAAFFGLGIPVAALGVLLYYLPYRLTGLLADRSRSDLDVRATWKVLVGALLHAGWTLALAAVAWWRGGPLAGLAAIVALPLLALATMHVLERVSSAGGEARRFFLRVRRGGTLAELRQRQAELARRLMALRAEVPA